MLALIVAAGLAVIDNRPRATLRNGWAFTSLSSRNTQPKSMDAG